MFLRWWKNRINDRVIGLDISANAIRTLEINSSNSQFIVESFGYSPLPEGVFVKDKIMNAEVLSTALKDTLRISGAQSKEIALAIPRSSVIIKNIAVDARLDNTELESRAWVEAGKHFPDLIGNIYLDFVVTGPIAHDPTQVDLMLVACRKEQIQPLVDILVQSGLSPNVIDVNCYAFERTLAILSPTSANKETVGLLNLNFNLSSLIVSEENNLLYAHDHSFDGQRLHAQATKYINAQEGKPILFDEPYIAVLRENLSSHLRHTIHFFYSSRSNVSLHKLYLSGDCATLPFLADFIQQETQITTLIANPFEGMTFSPQVDVEKIKEHAPTLALSCGLALSNEM